MTSEYLLLTIALTAAWIGITSVRHKDASWAIVSFAFAAAGIAGYLLVPDQAGTWLLAPFLILQIGPLLAVLLALKLIERDRLRAAAMVARVAWLLHPSRKMRRQLDVVKAAQLAATGDAAAAQEILQQTHLLGEDALELEQLRLEQRWEDVIARVESRDEQARSDHASVVYLRALGETGQLDQMVECYRTLQQRWRGRLDVATELASSQLFVAAFLGQLDLVTAIITGPLAESPASIKLFWYATAEAVAGKADEAAHSWAELRAHGDERMHLGVARRIEHPPARVEILTPAAAEVVGVIGAALADAETYAPSRRVILCYAIAAVLCIVHGYVWWRTRHDPGAIVDLGLFWSPAVLEDGEWWRLVTAVVLHASWLHLAFNLFGLLWLGPFVERFLGRVRFAIIFLVGGVAGFAVLAALDATGVREPTAALGASGAIMALLGASTAIFWRGSKQQRSPTAARRLRDMLGYVGAQVVFDILAPQVSMTGHLSGLVVGFLLGLAIKRR